MASGHPPRSGGPKPAKHAALPTEWRIELPESGRQLGAEFGGCRSIEAGYNRHQVLGQGTYGEVGTGAARSRTVSCISLHLQHPGFCSAASFQAENCMPLLPGHTAMLFPAVGRPTGGHHLAVALAGVPGHRQGHGGARGGQEDQDGQREGGLPHHSHPRSARCCCLAGAALARVAALPAPLCSPLAELPAGVCHPACRSRSCRRWRGPRSSWWTRRLASPRR
jgi:hypothetical protein